MVLFSHFFHSTFDTLPEVVNDAKRIEKEEEENKFIEF